MSLVAKAVFNELTVEDALDLAAPDEIQVRTPYDQLYVFRSWVKRDGYLHLFPMPTGSPIDFWIPLADRLDNRDDAFLVRDRDIELSFYRLVPFRVSDVLSSEKLDHQGE